jgi:hypothetical protein
MMDRRFDAVGMHDPAGDRSGGRKGHLKTEARLSLYMRERSVASVQACG